MLDAGLCPYKGTCRAHIDNVARERQGPTGRVYHPVFGMTWTANTHVITHGKNYHGRTTECLCGETFSMVITELADKYHHRSPLAPKSITSSNVESPNWIPRPHRYIDQSSIASGSRTNTQILVRIQMSSHPERGTTQYLLKLEGCDA